MKIDEFIVFEDYFDAFLDVTEHFTKLMRTQGSIQNRFWGPYSIFEAFYASKHAQESLKYQHKVNIYFSEKPIKTLGNPPLNVSRMISVH